MLVDIGDRFGHYDVIALLGEGGMGRVYRATDTKLRRDVALKILPEAFVDDRDRLVRFEREAHVLASLNHPNIAAIYGLEEGRADAGPREHALVLELVEGRTLAERIAQGPIPLDEALPIASRLPRHWRQPTTPVSSTETSSPPTSSSDRTVPSRCSTSAWPRRSRRIRRLRRRTCFRNIAAGLSIGTLLLNRNVREFSVTNVMSRSWQMSNPESDQLVHIAKEILDAVKVIAPKHKVVTARREGE